MLNTETIQSLIDSGEGYNVEFKVRVPSKVRELTEEICAFANADGGYLLIGVDDNGQVVDTNLENDKRSAIQGSISEISPALHCELYSVNIVNKTVWVIDVPSGKDKPNIFSIINELFELNTQIALPNNSRYSLVGRDCLVSVSYTHLVYPCRTEHQSPKQFYSQYLRNTIHSGVQEIGRASCRERV